MASIFASASSIDSPGMLLLCAFGLPPLNHYIDDPLLSLKRGGETTIARISIKTWQVDIGSPTSNKWGLTFTILDNGM